MITLAIVPGCLFAGSMVYSGMVVVAAWQHRRRSAEPQPAGPEIPISVLKPLAGVDEGLYENLESFFLQQYRTFELIFAARHRDDPAVHIMRSLEQRYPEVRTQLIVTGEPPYPNAKVFSLSVMTAAASADVFVMSDSDIRVGRDFLSGIASEVRGDSYDLATCPYRAIGGRTIWSRLEALGMNTEFWGGVVVAKLVEGVRFTVGPTTVAKREVLEAVPWSTLSGYLAEDFVLGQRAANLGFRVDLSRCVVEHRLPTENMRANLSHRLRWARSTRRSRPAGYVGQVFTYPLALALLLITCDSRLVWPVLLVGAIFRGLSIYAIAKWVLRDASILRRSWMWVAVQDLLGFFVWISGFSGNTIRWRDRRYRLKSDGTFDLAT
ncbi:MAG: glycosyltransferase [Acidobacteriaceae bacterium]|nr:glycosyltransferase [Acidobacteriaceae bacterium]